MAYHHRWPHKNRKANPDGLARSNQIHASPSQKRLEFVGDAAELSGRQSPRQQQCCLANLSESGAKAEPFA